MDTRILLVDDSAMVLRLIAHTLKKEGYEVITANDGQEGLDQLNGQDIDLLITDLNMPHRNGLSLLNEMRELERYRFLPAILFVNQPREHILTYVHNKGATVLFSKDDIKNELAATVHKLLG